MNALLDVHIPVVFLQESAYNIDRKRLIKTHRASSRK